MRGCATCVRCSPMRGVSGTHWAPNGCDGCSQETRRASNWKSGPGETYISIFSYCKHSVPFYKKLQQWQNGKNYIWCNKCPIQQKSCKLGLVWYIRLEAKIQPMYLEVLTVKLEQNLSDNSEFQTYSVWPKQVCTFWHLTADLSHYSEGQSMEI